VNVMDWKQHESTPYVTRDTAVKSTKTTKVTLLYYISQAY